MTCDVATQDYGPCQHPTHHTQTTNVPKKLQDRAEALFKISHMSLFEGRRMIATGTQGPACDSSWPSGEGAMLKRCRYRRFSQKMPDTACAKGASFSLIAQVELTSRPTYLRCSTSQLHCASRYSSSSSVRDDFRCGCLVLSLCLSSKLHRTCTLVP